MDTKQGKTKKQQRLESDAKILKSTIELIGEQGYTHTSLSQIAKGAGVTSGLIVQRYESKDNLLIEAYKKVVRESFTDEDEYIIIPGGLYKILDEWKALYEKNPSYFKFLKVLLNKQELPEAFVKVTDDLFSQRQTFAAIVDAQKENRIVNVDPHKLFQAYISQVVTQIEISEQYGIPYPENEFFIRILQIVDNDKLTKTEQRDRFVKSFFDGFDAICYVFLKENRVEELTIPKELKGRLDTNDAIGTFKNAVDHTVRDDYRQALLDFYTIDNLNERMKDKNMVHISVKDIEDRDRTYIISVAKRDDNGEIEEFVLAVHNN